MPLVSVLLVLRIRATHASLPVFLTAGEICAMKELPLAFGDENTIAEGLMREVDVLAMLDHDNIVRYLGSSRQNDSLQIMMEYVAGACAIVAPFT